MTDAVESGGICSHETDIAKTDIHLVELAFPSANAPKSVESPLFFFLGETTTFSTKFSEALKEDAKVRRSFLLLSYLPPLTTVQKN